ncbi:hypothetical protein OU787_17460 [Kitasatospora sp. YST-16]|uniref:hypothetical protein n=1 Tax=Kitasatospora sp. YST-16 TaxID=2998080 RepID=UPI00228523A3|nr:hypothetical protein [Kitasatospora sp. YST-16]WAL73138.1 hypothetical protein OU787_17460 [Kitasatospora sp. YST-16]WNW39192.1 hypothetical protein RKE32_17425 [Streptomyces sp. Li-HN-5-13]
MAQHRRKRARQPDRQPDRAPVIAEAWRALQTALQALSQLGEVPQEFTEFPGKTYRATRAEGGKWFLQVTDPTFPGWVNAALTSSSMPQIAGAFEEARTNAARQAGAVPDYTWTLTQCSPSYVGDTTLITCPSKGCGRPVELVEGVITGHQHPEERPCRASFVRIVPLEPY